MTRKYLLDLAERTAATYLETLLGLLLVGWADWGTVSEFLDFGTSAAVAAVPAGLAVLKGGLARLRGDRENPSLVAPPIRSELDR
jgi:hypothetical protein